MQEPDEMFQAETTAAQGGLLNAKDERRRPITKPPLRITVLRRCAVVLRE